jgi:hypothetical protein
MTEREELSSEKSFKPALDVTELFGSANAEAAYGQQKLTAAKKAVDGLAWNDRPTQEDFKELVDRTGTRVPFERLRTWWAEGQREAGRMEHLPRQDFSVAERSYSLGKTERGNLEVTLTGFAKQAFPGGRERTDILVSVGADRDGVIEKASDIYKVTFEGEDVRVAVGQEDGFHAVPADSEAYKDALNYITMSQEPESVTYKEGYVPSETEREASDARTEKDTS